MPPIRRLCGRAFRARARHADRRRPDPAPPLRWPPAPRPVIPPAPRCPRASAGPAARQAAAAPRLDWQPVHGFRRRDAVRQPGRAAGLRRPVGPEDHPGAVHGPGDRPGRPAPGRPAGQPRRPRRQRALPRRRGRLRPDQQVASEYNIIGFDPRGVGASVPALHCDPSLLRRRAARLHPGEPGRRAGPHHRARDLRRRLRAPVRLAAAVHDHRGRGQGHGLHPGRAGPAEDQLPRLLLRHLPRPGLRHPVRRTGSGGWCWTAPSTRRASGTPTTSPRTTRSRAGSRRSSPGSPRTPPPTSSAPPARRCSRPGTGPAPSWPHHPIDGPYGPLIGPDEFDDTLLQGGYSNTLWPGLAAALAAYLHSGSSRALISQYEQRSAARTRTSSPSTTRSSAATSTGRATGPTGTPTPGGSTGPRRSRPGTTPGSTRPAPSGRCTARPGRWPSTAPGLPPILMIQGSLDPATPYRGAQAAHRQLPSARMVVVEGGGNHGQSLSQPPNLCVNSYLNAYLATGALPASATGSSTPPARPCPPRRRVAASRPAGREGRQECPWCRTRGLPPGADTLDGCCAPRQAILGTAPARRS